MFAALQINFVSFAAPVATLALMESRGASDRHLAATLAMVMAMAQANVAMPMMALGLYFPTVLAFSLVGGLLAAAASYYAFGRRLSEDERLTDETVSHHVAASAKGVLDVINHAGAEAFKIAVGALPLLVLSLVFVQGLRAMGAVEALTQALAPVMGVLHLDPAMILPTITKYIAGGTAMMGVMDEMLRSGQAAVAMLNGGAGFLIHPFDVAGVAVLISAGPRVTAVWKPAALGACVGIAARTIAHTLVG